MTNCINQPKMPSERLVTIDIIRGVALLGILIMNIQSFSMVFSAYSNPSSFGDINGINFTIYYFSHLFADQKFMTIFSLLFGTGIVLMADNIIKKQGDATKIHYKRMAILALVGLAHAYLLWYGDILFAYAISGMIAYSARKKSPKFLIILGVSLIALCSLVMYAAGISLPYWEATEIQEVQAFWAPSAEAIKQDILANQASWLGQMEIRHQMAASMQGNLPFYLPRVIGLMFIGMAFYKLNFFGDRFTNRSLLLSGIIALTIGLALIIKGNANNFAANWQLSTMFVGSQYNYWGSLTVAYAYIAFLVVFCRTNVFGRVKAMFANVGKMALTNYLSHTLICGFIFYGWGLGLYGTVERREQILVVLAIWVFQLWFSSYWMKHFRFGPFEWLWRSMTYGRLQPLRKNQEQLALTESN
ncbi:hypothetical protein tinsulaeT_16440 [Thalassotalea insulae]|uniref:DUF418 domain-containing protein n=1 Tax=Thalassotalea insulae TaxID=2056778 RepID=A0ABQ6GSK3_9GAMM|nr:DUF418 domain-containing protein [Thalassotalea insulae]GLX78304.1 hypothetical protein tinsulaeT_16440 [Thalassotalea insulae]